MARIGAHFHVDHPLNEAIACGADAAQFFLGDPQGWKGPVIPGGDPAAIRDAFAAAGVDIYIHAPYVINVATSNNRIRIPSRKILGQQLKAAASVGAKGLIVHGGHVTKGEEAEAGFENWRKLFERQAESGGFDVPILIENTAGGDNAMARRFDALARLWDAVGDLGAGFCLDTCHAFAAGEDLVGIVERVKAITGRIDLVHLNSSRDEFNSARDRHANIADGTIEPEQLVAVLAAAQAPAVVETPDEGQAADIEFLRAKLGG
jgi:deoxyribonuclease-4